METEEITACILALEESSKGTLSSEEVDAFIQSLKQSNEEKMSKTRRSKKQGRTSGLDEVLSGVEEEAAQLVRTYRL